MSEYLRSPGRAGRAMSPPARVAAALTFLIMAVAPVPYPGSEVVISVAAATTIMLGLQVPVLERAPLRGHLLLAFGAVALCSAAWSVAPLASVRGGAQVVILAAAAIIAARVLDMEALLRTMRVALRCLLVVSVAVAVAVPSIGLVWDDYETGALRGIFDHRNLLAFVSCVALATFWTGRATSGRRLFLFDITLGAVCIVATQSQSALLVAAAMLATWAAVRLASRITGDLRFVALAAGIALILGIALFVVVSLEQVVGTLGRDLTFTGRTVIWEAVLDVAGSDPVTGVGWSAGWLAGSPVTNRIWRATGFSIYQGHSGYIDVFFFVGFTGLAFLALILAVQLFRAAFLPLFVTTGTAMWPLALAIASVVANISESRFTTLFGWLVVCITTMATSRAYHDMRRSSSRSVTVVSSRPNGR